MVACEAVRPGIYYIKEKSTAFFKILDIVIVTKGLNSRASWVEIPAVCFLTKNSQEPRN
jgi:hypothetical protein